MSDYPMLISNKLHSFRNFLAQKYNNHLKISYNSHTRLEYCLQIHSIYWRGITKIELFANGYSRYCPLSIIHKFWGGYCQW